MRTPLSRALTITWVVVSIIALYPFSTVRGEQTPLTADLRPHFTPGRVTRYHVWTQRQQKQIVVVGDRSQEFESSFEIEGEVTWTVKQVRPDGSAICLMNTDWLVATLINPKGDTQRCDSRKTTGQSEQLHGLLRAIAGVPIQIEANADGSIVKATGIDQVKRKAPDDTDVPDADRLHGIRQ